MSRATAIALSMLFLLVGCAITDAPRTPAGAPGDQVLRVSAEQVARCQQGGGCHLLTREAMEELAARMYELGQAEGGVDCRRGRI